MSGDGGNVSILAADAIVGSITVNDSTDPTRLHLLGQSDGFVYMIPFKGGDVMIKTDVPLKAGAITSEGAVQGQIAIAQRDVPSQDTTGAIGLTDLPWLNKTGDVNQTRRNVLTFMEARKLAGQKKTAQQIADQLNIPLSVSQLAVLSPIGESIQVPIPDLQGLYNDGVDVAGDGDVLPLGCESVCQFLYFGMKVTVYVGTAVIVTAVDSTGKVVTWTGEAARGMLQHFLPSKSSRQSKKDRSTDIPSWAKGQKQNPGESAEEFAKRLLDDKYGPGNWDKGPGTEYNKIRKKCR